MNKVRGIKNIIIVIVILILIRISYIIGTQTPGFSIEPEEPISIATLLPHLLSIHSIDQLIIDSFGSGLVGVP